MTNTTSPPSDSLNATDGQSAIHLNPLSLPIPPIPPIILKTQAEREIDAKYRTIGAGRIGTPQSSYITDADRSVHMNFLWGAIYWIPNIGAHAMYGNIWKKWIATPGMGLPITDEASTADNVCRFNDFQNGASIYWTPAHGAFLVYGDIRVKWLASGGEAGPYGYPLTDELAAGAAGGRYNDFQGGSIYWTPTTGAHLIYGDIRGKWLAIGGPQNALGYPITDETTSASGGRYNDFQGGTIYWSPNTGAHEHLGAMPQSLTFAPGQLTFKSGVAAGGWINLVVSSDGLCRFRGNFHDSGAVNYNYSVGSLLIDADNTAFSFGHSGTIHGTFSPGSRDDSWDTSVTDARIRDSWRALVASATFPTHAHVALDIGSVIGTIVSTVGYVVKVVQIIASVA